MISTPKNHHTQIDLETLRGLKTYSQTSFLNQLTENNTFYNYNALAREKLYFLDKDNVDSKTGLQHFKFFKTIKSGVKAHKYVKIKHGFPWRIYEKTY